MTPREFVTAPVMVWHLAGRPRRASLTAEPVPGVCAMCGQHAEDTVHVKRTIAGKSFTDQYLLRRPDSVRTCYACAWVCTGKGMDQVRMWTVLARTDRDLPPSNPKAQYATSHLHCTSRADMRAVVDTLADPPAGQWVVAVAESGQKHTLPYAAVNRGPGRWRVRMDAADITATPAEFRDVFSRACALRKAGHAAAEIENLEPSYARLATPGALGEWTAHATPIAPWKKSPLLHLAVFLITKEHLDEYTDRYPAGPTRGFGRGIPGHDAGLGRRGHDRPDRLVGPGPHGPGNRDGHGHGLF